MPAINKKSFMEKASQLEHVVAKLKRNGDIGWNPNLKEAERYSFLWSAIQKSKKKNGGTGAFCKLCNKFFSDNLGMRSLMEHVTSRHLGLKLFLCKFCPRALQRSNNFLRYHTMFKHPEECVGLETRSPIPAKSPFIDLSDEYHEQIVAMCSECFYSDDDD